MRIMEYLFVGIGNLSARSAPSLPFEPATEFPNTPAIDDTSRMMSPTVASFFSFLSVILTYLFFLSFALPITGR